MTKDVRDKAIILDMQVKIGKIAQEIEESDDMRA